MNGKQGGQLSTIYVTSDGIGNSSAVLTEARNVHNVGSVTSIPVVREQYCLCSPTTRLEKRLIMTVIVLIVVVLVLLVGISILADKVDDKDFGDVMKAMSSKF